MIVADIVGKESLEVALVAGDDMVEQIAAATAHPSLGDSVLPWTAEGDANPRGVTLVIFSVGSSLVLFTITYEWQ